MYLYVEPLALGTCTVKPALLDPRAAAVCWTLIFSHHHGFSLEETAACWETCIQVPVCGLLPGADG